MIPHQHPASYRDPAGYLYTKEGILYRAVQEIYAPHYTQLMDGGLYDSLQSSALLIPHLEVAQSQEHPNEAWKILKPLALEQWSYPYEWCFGQLKDAAFATLTLALKGLEHGMILKDANAYNIQFYNGRPLLIDTLSFEIYQEGNAWQAFRQFCNHFLNPLLVMRALPDLSPAFLMAYPDGISSKLTAKILPWTKRLSFNHQLYVYLAAGTSRNQIAGDGRKLHITSEKIKQNLNQLQKFISQLNLKPAKSAWNNYYEETILSNNYLASKTKAVRSLLERVQPKVITDIGCNTGVFSLIASEFAETVIALDFDPLSVEKLYAEKKPNIYPLVADIAYPTPALGWANEERSSLIKRISAEMVMALAVVHHLALSNNVPLSQIGALFSGICSKWLIVEFVPKTDPRAQQLLAGKGDIFPHYTQSDFEDAFGGYFQVEDCILLSGSTRILYLLKKKESASIEPSR